MYIVTGLRIHLACLEEEILLLRVESDFETTDVSATPVTKPTCSTLRDFKIWLWELRSCNCKVIIIGGCNASKTHGYQNRPSLWCNLSTRQQISPNRADTILRILIIFVKVNYTIYYPYHCLTPYCFILNVVVEPSFTANLWQTANLYMCIVQRHGHVLHCLESFSNCLMTD